VLIDLLEFVRKIGIRIAIPHAADDEFVQVAVRPTERGLKDAMQSGQFDGLGHEETTPYRRGHIEQLDLKLPRPRLLAADCSGALRLHAAISITNNVPFITPSPHQPCRTLLPERCSDQMPVAIETLRLFRYDLSALRHIDRRAVHTRRFAGGLRCPSKRPPYSGSKTLGFSCMGLGFHIFRSNNTGDAPELSYTAQDSDIGR
jgi:hypothetical protein